jgi:hypothetical protein
MALALSGRVVVDSFPHLGGSVPGSAWEPGCSAWERLGALAHEAPWCLGAPGSSAREPGSAWVQRLGAWEQRLGAWEQHLGAPGSLGA